MTISQIRGLLVNRLWFLLTFTLKDILHFLWNVTSTYFSRFRFDLLHRCHIAFHANVHGSFTDYLFFRMCHNCSISALYSLSTPLPLTIDYQIIPFQGHLCLSSKSIFIAALAVLDSWIRLLSDSRDFFVNINDLHHFCYVLNYTSLDY